MAEASFTDINATGRDSETKLEDGVSKLHINDAQDVFNIKLDKEIRMILVGKAGVGKSSTGNTILGKNIFKTAMQSSTVTTKSQHGSRLYRDRRVVVVDTPGLFDASEKNSEPHVKEEIKSCMRYTAPGIHAIILVLSAATRFTKEDKQCFEAFFNIFGSTFYDYVIVAFTHADVLSENNTTLEQYIGNDILFQEFLKKCGSRMILLNSRNPNAIENEKQLSHLFDLTLLVSKQYTDKSFEEAELEMVKREERIRKEKEKEMNEQLSHLEKKLNSIHTRKTRELEQQFEIDKQIIIHKYENDLRNLRILARMNEPKTPSSHVCNVM